MDALLDDTETHRNDHDHGRHWPHEPAAGWHDAPSCAGWWFLRRPLPAGGPVNHVTVSVSVYETEGSHGQTILKGVFRHGRDFICYGMGRWYGPVVLPADEGGDGG